MAQRDRIYLPKRGLDHIVPAVRNLDVAAATWARLGFTLTPRAMHPWGTSNRLVQLHGFFVEVLEVADPSKLMPMGRRFFSFGAYLADYLTKREGIAMTVFESVDARADRDQFVERGLPDLEPFDFQRQAKLPNGESVTLAFSLAFAPPESSPDAVFFTCQQHAPDYFWKPEYQVHANTAIAVDEVTMVAPDPASYASVLGQLQVPEAVHTDRDGSVLCETLRGRVRVATPQCYESWMGCGPAVDAPAGPHFAALRVVVEDLDVTQRLLHDRAFETHWAPAGLIVTGRQVHGCTLAFAQG